MTYNYFIVNPEAIEQFFETLTQNSPVSVQNWFKHTLCRFWLARWTERGALEAEGPIKSKPVPIPQEYRSNAKDRQMYGRTHMLLTVPPRLRPVVLNTPTGIAFKDLPESAIKALTNGATLKQFPSTAPTNLSHVRDYLEYFVEQYPKKGQDLSKLNPLDVPSAVTQWDRGLRKLREIKETEESIATLFTAKNGYTICVIGSQKASVHVGNVLRNCLRTSTSYFNNDTLLCVKDETGKILVAAQVRLRMRVSGVRLNSAMPKEFQGPFAVQAMDIHQFYGPENLAPSKEAVVAFNEFCVECDIRLMKNVDLHAATTRDEWLDEDAVGDDEDEQGEEEEEEEDEEEDEIDDEEEDELRSRPAKTARPADDEDF